MPLIDLWKISIQLTQFPEVKAIQEAIQDLPPPVWVQLVQMIVLAIVLIFILYFLYRLFWPTFPKSGVDMDKSSGKIFSVVGVQDLLEVFENKVAITPKGLGALVNKGLKGTKEIPFSSIGAIQFKKAGFLTNGYLQFSIVGGNENTGGLFAAVRDENSFLFRVRDNDQVLKIKEFISSEVLAVKTPQMTAPTPTATSSLSGELQNLADLKEKGVLSEEEFQAAKKKLIEE